MQRLYNLCQAEKKRKKLHAKPITSILDLDQ